VKMFELVFIITLLL